MVQTLRSGMIRVNALKIGLIFSVNLIASFFSVQKYERSVPINGSNDRYTDKWLILLSARLDLGVAEDLGT